MVPFAMIPPSAFVTSYNQLSPEEKARHDRVEEWAETKNGHAVHQAWSKYTDAMVKRAQKSDEDYKQGKGMWAPLGTDSRPPQR